VGHQLLAGHTGHAQGGDERIRARAGLALGLLAPHHPDLRLSLELLARNPPPGAREHVERALRQTRE